MSCGVERERELRKWLWGESVEEGLRPQAAYGWGKQIKSMRNCKSIKKKIFVTIKYFYYLLFGTSLLLNYLQLLLNYTCLFYK